MKRKIRKQAASSTKENAPTSSDESFECDICQKTFSKFIHLSNHISSHLNDTLLECSHCPEVFLRMDDYLEHSVAKHTVKTEPSEDFVYTQGQNGTDAPCNLPIKVEPDFGFTYSQHSSGFCNLQPSENNLITPDKQYNADFQGTSGFKKEPPQKVHQRDSGQLYECNICAVTYTRMRDLLKHTRDHIPKQLHKKQKIQKLQEPVGKVQKRFECNICLKLFDRMKDLVAHAPDHADIAEKLSADNLFCQHCDQDFPSKKLFISHMKLHEAPPEAEINLAREFMCEEISEGEIACVSCGERFTYMVQLTEHMKWCTEFVCDICSQKFITQQRLSDHLSSHLTDTLHECHHCQEVFLIKQDLVHHMDLHLLNL